MAMIENRWYPVDSRETYIDRAAYSNRSYSSRDQYLLRRYDELTRMAQEFASSRSDVHVIATGLAVIDLTLEVKDLPARMPIPIMPENKLDVRIVSDHINAAMSELYK